MNGGFTAQRKHIVGYRKNQNRKRHRSSRSPVEQMDSLLDGRRWCWRRRKSPGVAWKSVPPSISVSSSAPGHSLCWLSKKQDLPSYSYKRVSPLSLSQLWDQLVQAELFTSLAASGSCVADTVTPTPWKFPFQSVKNESIKSEYLRSWYQWNITETPELCR